ncbi:hypothetical protein [Sulfurihydrogenibium azorense]|uniref:hypothetical protein n=1 Tax=Sulfurihydrogenibium azorense TaxID=309806 RepID=UPI00240A07F1|nr:hypothetical protein [Sulfurihydrogenibium azorense]MDM7273994.1 hypothetical protein [Sulfurihydrogenibium azorense]
MNTIQAYVVSVEFTDTISQVKLSTELGDFYCIVLENPNTVDYLKVGKSVKLIFKENDFIFSKEKIFKINTFEGVIKSITEGEIFYMINFEAKNYQFSALLSKHEVDDFKINDKIYVYIKPTNIILEV